MCPCLQSNLRLEEPMYRSITYFLNNETAVERADAIARQSDVVAALTLEVMKGTTTAFETGNSLYLLI